MLNGSHEAEGGTQLSALLLEGHSDSSGKANRGVRSPLKSAIAITQAEKTELLFGSMFSIDSERVPRKVPKDRKFVRNQHTPFPEKGSIGSRHQHVQILTVRRCPTSFRKIPRFFFLRPCARFDTKTIK